VIEPLTVASQGAVAKRSWATSGLAVVAGASAGFAHPPWGFLVGLLGYGLLMGLVDQADIDRPLRSAFLRGWLAGAAYFTVCFWWLFEPFQVDAAEQGWMAPFAVAFMAGGLALFWGCAATVYRGLAATGPARWLLFGGVMVGFEWLRGHVLTGLPWDLPGETWWAGSAPSQGAALVGAYGLSWPTVLIGAAPAVWREGRGGKLVGAAAVAAALGLYAFGALRLAQAQHPEPAAPVVRVVQADVRQESKYDERVFANIVGRYLTLTARPAKRAAAIVVWPEGAIPAALEDYLAPGTWTANAITAALTPGQILLVGGYRWTGEERPVAFNSLAALRRTSTNLVAEGVYDKFRLVPFGEFMPLDSLAARLGIKQLVHVGDGFVPGPRPRPLAIAGAPAFQPLICYESLFPGFTREGGIAANLRARWIVNVSNDAWFGTTSGPLQHLNIASYRAIEEGLPMVRATPTGVSAVIDAYGRIAPGEQLDQGATGVIDAPLPPALKPTLFSRIGDLPLLAMLVVSLAGARWPRRRAVGRT
jgi:apolipoprotein N-acyltransferase